MTRYRNSTVYQIYPRSFYDSNGDGIGDIRGIISKLDYLKAIGVDVIWLSPVYKSPNDDNGYDISDYKAIHEDFGTMADFDEMLAEAKKRGISIIMDLVINHTSDEHEWFKRALAGEEKYKNYYIIKKGTSGMLPNNWGNFFADCPWQPFGDPKNEEYYLHLFSKKQPDLNWHNPEVYDEICDIMRFWLDKGIAGFRCDVINIIYKNTLADGKKQLALTGNEHYVCTDGCHDILKRLRRDVMDHYDAFTVGETVMVNLQQAADLSHDDRRELDMVFAFEHMEVDQIGVKWFKTKFKPKKLMKCLTKWQTGLNWNTCYFENHDQPRSVTRFTKGGEYRRISSKMLLGLLFSLRGTTFVYQGQEIGMTNGGFNSLNEIKDIESHNVDKMAKGLGIINPFRWKLIKKTTRDNARTPMQWDHSDKAGFTDGEPWLKLHPNHFSVNVQHDLSYTNGILYYFKKLNDYKHASPVLQDGSFKELYAGRKIYAFERALGDERLVAICNFSHKNARNPLTVGGDIEISNYHATSIPKVLRPYEFLLIKVRSI